MCFDCLREARRIQKRCEKMLKELEETKKQGLSGFISAWALENQKKAIEVHLEQAKREETEWLQAFN